MKKWLASMLVLGVVMLALMPVASSFAAVADDEQLEQEILAIRRQMLELRKQIIDKSVAAGKLTAEEGEKCKQKLEERFEWHLQHGFDKKYKQGKGKIKKLRPNPSQDVPVE